MKKLTIIILFSLAFSFSTYADTDGKIDLSKNDSGTVKDCFEGINRGIFAFNQALDGAVFEPVAKAYRRLPHPVKKGSANVLRNISSLVTIPNNLLQGDIKTAGVNATRFVLNTTVGVLGIFDAAQAMGFSITEKEDYGQSLATYGVGPGCYIVLPVLGPSTARDTVASLTNFMGGDAWYNVTVRNDTRYFSDVDYYSSKITNGVDFRAKNFESIENLKKNSLDFYASVKSLYLQDRQQKILNSKKIIETQDDSGWEEIETQ